jgi:hypothetical protein
MSMMMSAMMAASRRRFNPLSLSPALWFDASDANTLFDATTGGSLVAADGTVARWEDKSGNNRHATQSTSGSRPIRKTSIQNGRDVIRFDGSDDFLFVGSFAINQRTIFAVCRTSNNANQQHILRKGFVSTTSLEYLVRAQNATTMRHLTENGGPGASVDASNTANAWRIAEAGFNGSSISIRVNAGSESTATSANNPERTFRLRIGASYSSDSDTATPADVLNGDIGELIIYPTSLSAGDRSAVYSYLAAKWAI